MDSDSRTGLLAWLPLAAVTAVLFLVVALFWLVQPQSDVSRNAVSAEAVPSERVQPRPTATSAPTPTPSVVTPAGTVEAPGFRGIVQWINSEPLVLEEQQGKVVLIDFWTYS
ncbi:MAG: hypothetical protein OXE17_12100 [Chloroflexi bacterium]|nr:hypothetical protein [Chloroflexota bacterium]